MSQGHTSNVCMQALGLGDHEPPGSPAAIMEGLPAFCHRSEFHMVSGADWWPPKQHVHILIPETCECPGTYLEKGPLQLWLGSGVEATLDYSSGP